MTSPNISTVICFYFALYEFQRQTKSQITRRNMMTTPSSHVSINFSTLREYEGEYVSTAEWNKRVVEETEKE